MDGENGKRLSCERRCTKLYACNAYCAIYIISLAQHGIPHCDAAKTERRNSVDESENAGTQTIQKSLLPKKSRRPQAIVIFI